MRWGVALVVAQGESMNFKALVFAIAGLVVAAFYAFESYLFYQANGFAAPLVVKLLICGVGAYFSWRNARRVRKGVSDGASASAAR